MSPSPVELLSEWVDFSDPALQYAAFLIVLAPTLWNILGRSEYYTHWITKLAGGNRYLGCYLLAVYIFSFSLYRDWVVDKALASQPQLPLLGHVAFVALAAVLGVVGLVLVLSSTWALGITGTYLGDYFGILMKSRVTSFPFNVLNNPMYDGSSMLFLANAIWHRSPAGLLLAGLVFVVYRFALMFEEPFTARIYANKSAETGKAKSKGKSKRVD